MCSAVFLVNKWSRIVRASGKTEQIQFAKILINELVHFQL